VCKVKKLFSVVYSVVSAVLDFHFKLVTNETYNDWRPVERG
jgi:hypothetical protein